MPNIEYYKKWLKYFSEHPEEAVKKSKWIAKAKEALESFKKEENTLFKDIIEINVKSTTKKSYIEYKFLHDGEICTATKIARA